MNRQDLVLAALAASEGADHTPVQVQKLLFLIDQKIPEETGGPHYAFRPHDYGPFDGQVYRDLEELGREGLVEISRDPEVRWKTYRLTARGQDRGEEVLRGLEPRVSDYLKRLSEWLRGQSFPQLVSAIYGEFPEMKANSVFR